MYQYQKRRFQNMLFFLRLIEGLFLDITLQPVACCSVQHHQVSFTTVQRTLAGNVLCGLICNMLKQSDNSPDIACRQSYSESHSAQIGYIHGARNGNRTGRFHERRRRYARSNLKFTMDNGKVDIISETNLYVLYRL